MINSIEEYLQLLKKELSGCDKAAVQDALFDAEEHLRFALESELAGSADNTPEKVLPRIFEEFGSPEEVAAAYKEMEHYTRPALSKGKQEPDRNFVGRFFGVFADPRAWGALLFCFISFITGVIYFSWTITGISTSLGFSILIFGVPFAGLFLLSIRGLALLEGRIVEGLLGVRMPRRPIFVNKNLKLLEKIKYLVTSKDTWLNILYMILQFPLGTLYFCLFITLLATSLGLMAAPFLQLVWHLPIIQLGSEVYILSIWQLAAFFIVGVLLFPATLHLAKLVGKLHGKLAKFLLVSEL